MEREFEMMFDGELRSFTAEFEYDAWTDCFDSSDYRSEFIDWEYNITSLYFTDEDGTEFLIDYDLLRPEFKALVDYEINAEIENQVL